MFWGVILEGGKKVTQKVNEPFHITMAALELPPESDKTHSVFLEVKDQKFLLCSLSPLLLQVPLNLKLSSGSDIGLFVSGGSKKSKVHLTGYHLADSDNMSTRMLTPPQKTQHSILVSDKKKADGTGNKKKVSIQEASDTFSTPNGDAFGGKKPKLTFLGDELYEDEDDLDSSEEDGNEEEDEEEKDAFELDDDDDEDEEGEEEDEDSDEFEDDSDLMDEEETPALKPEKVVFKKSNDSSNVEKSKSPQKGDAGKKGNEPKTPESKKNKTDSPRTPEGFKTPEQNSKIKTPSSVGNTPMKFVTKGGVMVQEIKVGNGIPAKPGKMANVNYVGRLKQNNKQFDAGSIKFRIGKGEVIKGWDIGVEGMKIGGKRKLIIPPQLAYGKRGAAPDIPANSTLVFDVELKGVS